MGLVVPSEGFQEEGGVFFGFGARRGRGGGGRVPMGRVRPSGTGRAPTPRGVKRRKMGVADTPAGIGTPSVGREVAGGAGDILEELPVVGGVVRAGRKIAERAGKFKKKKGRFGHKRINPTNAKALRRAARRMAGFHKLSTRIEKQLRKVVKKSGFRSSSRRTGGSVGVITRAEALRALRE